MIVDRQISDKSRALEHWMTIRSCEFAELDHARILLERDDRGRHYANRQLVFDFVILLSSQFQGFCRELHFEVADNMADALLSVHPRGAAALRTRLVAGRKLDQGNPNSGNIGSDFSRIVGDFWSAVERDDSDAVAAKAQLEQLAQWRNAIAHNDFSADRLGSRQVLTLAQVQIWRGGCDYLATRFDAVLRGFLVQWHRPNVWDWRQR